MVRRTFGVFLQGLFVLALVLVAGWTPAIRAEEPGADAVPSDPPLRWWKGNIHTHSLWSDGNDFPEMIAEWYRTRDYNFLALSDHNILSEGVRWMKYDDIVRRGGKETVEKYQARFGGGWVETRGEQGAPDYEIRLKPLEEFRPLVEERGKFLMIQGEEISDRVGSKPLHMNATNIKELVRPLGGGTIPEAIENNLRAVEEQAQRAGREILLHINHPNFHYAITAEELAEVVSERFFEVYNGHPDVHHLGDATHPGLEQLWDIANTLRLAQLASPPLYGVATDDSHHYNRKEGGSTPGRGWIMVRSRYLTPDYLIRAIKAGDFYASSGVTLADVQFDSEKRVLRLDIAAEECVQYKTQFIGTTKGYDQTSKPRTGAQGEPLPVTREYSEDVGRVLATVEGPVAEYRLTGNELYVRAVVTSTRPHTNPSFENQMQQAWTQPVGWEVKSAVPEAAQ